MGYYEKEKYIISSHAIRRFMERSGLKLSHYEARLEIIKMIENTYEGKIDENGDRFLILYEDSNKYFIVNNKNVIKTFVDTKQ